MDGAKGNSVIMHEVASLRATLGFVSEELIGCLGGEQGNSSLNAKLAVSSGPFGACYFFLKGIIKLRAYNSCLMALIIPQR